MKIRLVNKVVEHNHLWKGTDRTKNWIGLNLGFVNFDGVTAKLEVYLDDGDSTFDIFVKAEVGTIYEIVKIGGPTDAETK